MVDITCERWSDLLGGYVDGALEPDASAAVEAHAASCAACHRFLEGYLAVPGLVRRATDVPIPPEVRARLAKLFAPDMGHNHKKKDS
jgi:anti-sigma factor RsiW